ERDPVRHRHAPKPRTSGLPHRSSERIPTTAVPGRPRGGGTIPAVPSPLPPDGPLPSSERQFFLDEFRRVTLVVSVDDPDEHDLAGLLQITPLLMDNRTRGLLR